MTVDLSHAQVLDKLSPMIHESTFNGSEYNWLGEFNASDYNDTLDFFFNVTPSTRPYYGDYFQSFKAGYLPVHKWIAVIVCVFGILANVLNIIVLTRKDMISPTNAILTALAVADMAVMAIYLPYCILEYWSDLERHERATYGFTVFSLFKNHSTIVCHTVSTWLTVTLAIWRFLAVSLPAISKTWCSMQRAKVAIVCTYLSCAVFCIPVYITFDISPLEHEGKSGYVIVPSEIARKVVNLRDVNFWIYSVLAKLIPCVALTGLSLGLIRVLYEANERRQRLKNRTENDKTHDRTTRMLLAILLLFLITEFPSGVVSLLSGILGDLFIENVYKPLGEAMDLLALINSAINFILYCSMSRQFRDTFAKLFTPKIFLKWMTDPTEPNTTADTTCV